MRAKKLAESWVVYEMLIRGKPTGMNAVCEQSEWDDMERIQPGAHPLIQSGITNEGVAEQLARATGVVAPKKPAKTHL